MRVARNVLILACAVSAVAPLVAAAPGAAAVSSKPSFTTKLLAGSSGFAEPRDTVTPDGTRYVDTNAKDGTEVVYRSDDGLSWKQVPGTPPGQTNPTTDVDIVSTRTGRLIASELDFTGINFITAYSDDKGKTWTSSTGTTYADTDRQWLAVGPDDATTHQPTVYLLFHNLLSGLLTHNMFVMTSTDGGATFGPPVPVATPPQQDWLDLQCADSGGPSNIFYDRASNRVFVVFGTRSSPAGGCAAQPVEVNVVAANRVWVVSAPADQTTSPTAWTPHLAVNDTGTGAGGASHITGMQLAPGASDTDGNVYVAYPESINDYPDYDGAAIKVVHASKTDLDHWSAPSVVAPPGGPGNVLPHIVAGKAGKVDVAYYHGVKTGSTLKWYSMAAQSLDALTASPHWSNVQLSNVVAEPSQTASELMGACMQGQQATLNGFACGRSADVYGVALDKCGGLVVTWPAQAGVATDGTYVSQQTGGSTLGLCQGSSSSGANTGRKTSANGDRTPSSTPRLAATGGTPWLAIGGLGLVVAAGLPARRRRRAA
jgi:hypothetical protein